MKEVFGPFFLVLSSVTNLKGLFLGVHKLFWQLLWKLLERFYDLRICWKHNFLKIISTFPVKKIYLTVFYHFMD